MKTINCVMLPKVEVNVSPQSPQGHKKASSNRSWNKYKRRMAWHYTIFAQMRKIMLNIKLKSQVIVKQYGESLRTPPLDGTSLYQRKQ